VKKFTLSLITLFLFFILPTAAAQADVIEMENGSKLTGAISKIDKDSIAIKTGFAGVITVKLTHVVSYFAQTPLFLSFPGNHRVFGKVTYTKKQTRVDLAEGGEFVSGIPPELGWPEGCPSPLERHWKYELGLDAAGKTGNTERFGTGGKFQAKLQGPEDKLLLYMRYAYTRDEGIESDNLVVGGIDFESYFRKIHSWYARLELEHDRIKSIELRTTAAVGYGYFLLKKPRHSLRVRIGMMYRHNDYRDQSSDSTPGLDIGLLHLYRFDNSWKVQNDITYTPSLENYHDYSVHHESYFEIPVAASEIWKLQLGMTNDYTGRPADDKQYLDTTYFGRLVLSWP